MKINGVVSGKAKTLIALQRPLLFVLTFVALSLYHLTTLPLLFADFEPTGAGARPAVMGNMFVAMADDVRAIYYNPAGLAYLKRSEFTADYGRLFTGLDDNSVISAGFVAFAQPISRKKSLDERIRDLRRITAIESQVEASTAAPSTPDAAKPEKKKEEITFFRDWGTLGMAFNNLTLSGAVSENTFWFSYSRKIVDKISSGMSVKLLYQSYTQDIYTQKDPVFNLGAKGDLLKFSFDAGLLYNLYPRIFWGLMITDVNRPNVALNSADSELLPIGTASGLAFKDRKIRAGVDAVYRDKDYRINAGAERWFRNRTYALRAGGSLGSREYKNVSYGMSVNWGNFQIDYAFVFPVSGVRETFGSHRMSFLYRFGKAPVDEMEAGSIELYYSKLQTEAEMLRARLEKAEDERSRLEKVLIEEALSRIKEKVRAERLESAAQPTTREKTPAQGVLPALTGIGGGSVSNMKTYVTSKGDSLQTISELFYGRKDRWIEIFNLNRDKVGRGGSLKTGTVLLVPGVGGTAPTAEDILTGTQKRALAPVRMEPIGGKTEPAAASGTLQPLGDNAPIAEGTTLAPKKETEPKKKEPAVKKEEARPKSYTVLPGDTLNSIAEKIYGDSKRWKEIYNANKDKVERGAVNPGQILTIP